MLAVRLLHCVAIACPSFFVDGHLLLGVYGRSPLLAKVAITAASVTPV